MRKIARSLLAGTTALALSSMQVQADSVLSTPRIGTDASVYFPYGAAGGKLKLGTNANGLLNFAPAQLPADVGDVARPAGSNTTTIQPGTVTAGKMATGAAAGNLGSAGGDLTGAFPAPTVSTVKGKTVLPIDGTTAMTGALQGVGGNVFFVPGTFNYSSESSGLELNYGGNSELTARPGGANQFDAVRGMVTNGTGNPTTGVGAGSNLVGQVSGIAGTVRGLVDNKTNPNNGYSVGVFGNATAEVNKAVSWASNFSCTDIGPDRSSTAVGNIGTIGAGTNRTCEGSEVDVNLFGQGSVGLGINIVGNFLIPATAPTFGITIGVNGSSQPPWAQGFSTSPGGAVAAFVSGPAGWSGNNVNSQLTVFNYLNGSGTQTSMNLQALAGTSNGNVLALQGTTAGLLSPNLFLPAGGQIQFNSKSSISSDASNNLYLGGGMAGVFLQASLAPQTAGGAQLGSGPLPFAAVYAQSGFITGTATSTSATTGALQVAGGVGMAKDLFVGGNEVVTGTLKSAAGLFAPFSNTSGAWMTYTPTLTCQSGTLTSATASGRYSTSNKTVNVAITAKVATLGSCTGIITASLPVTSVNAGTFQFLNGREDGSTGTILMGQIGPNAMTLSLLGATSNGTSGGFTLASGQQYDIGGSYESN